MAVEETSIFFIFSYIIVDINLIAAEMTTSKILF